ncbi:hypothetical protein HY522_02060 [bacterium]|nr:hypothetical protein [bacterium]
MQTLTYRQFQRAMLPTLAGMRNSKKSMTALARDLKSRPRPMTAPEMLMFLAHECCVVFSRREKKYV